ncbi:MAG: hypothetical protein WB622_07380, partial [Acidobacteriaceae bacterium]
MPRFACRTSVLLPWIPLLALAVLAWPLLSRAQADPVHPVHGDNGVTLPPPPIAAVHAVTDDYHG